MKITAPEIKQKSFRKVLTGGFDKDEVQAFLSVLAEEWEKTTDENREMRIKLDLSEKEVKKLREMESSLYQTLKSAEDTSHKLLDQANKSAEMHLKEVQSQAESLLKDAHQKAHTLLEEAEKRSKVIMEDTLLELQSMEADIRSIEQQRILLISEVKELAGEVLDKVAKADNRKQSLSLEKKIRDISDFLSKSYTLIQSSKTETNDFKSLPPPLKLPPGKQYPPSFFDEIS
jgi:cell division initiation protein